MAGSVQEMVPGGMAATCDIARSGLVNGRRTGWPLTQRPARLRRAAVILSVETTSPAIAPTLAAAVSAQNCMFSGIALLKGTEG